MGWLEFGELLNDNIKLYIILFVCTTILYFFIFRKVYISFIDPLIFNTLYSAFGFSVVWFLYYTSNIDIKYLISYLLTQIAFWTGLFSIKSLSKKSILAEKTMLFFKEEILFLKSLFFVTTLTYVAMQLLSYEVIGIPLLLGSHVDIYNGSGGWGILGHFIEVLKPLSIYLLLYFIFKKKSSFFFDLYKYLFLILLLVFFALSGSRSDFMTLGFVLFCYLILNASEEKKSFFKIGRYEKIIIITGLFFVFLTIIVQSSSYGGTSSLSIFLFRLVASGDTYFFSYPHKLIETIHGNKPFLALFGEIFATLRLVPRSNLPQVLGLQLYNIFYNSEVTAGPNARHNVFGYIYFGFYGSIIFSYSLGILLSYLRNNLFFKLRRSSVGQILFILLYLNFSIFETDPPVSFSGIENAMVVLPFVVTISIFFTMVLYSSKVNKLT